MYRHLLPQATTAYADAQESLPSREADDNISQRGGRPETGSAPGGSDGRVAPAGADDAQTGSTTDAGNGATMPTATGEGATAEPVPLSAARTAVNTFPNGGSARNPKSLQPHQRQPSTGVEASQHCDMTCVGRSPTHYDGVRGAALSLHAVQPRHNTAIHIAAQPWTCRWTPRRAMPAPLAAAPAAPCPPPAASPTAWAQPRRR